MAGQCPDCGNSMHVECPTCLKGEVRDLKASLEVANRERERLTREIVEAHRLVGSDGAHSALVAAIARLKKDNADMALLLEGAKADRPLGLGALVLVRAALEAGEDETTLDAARRVVERRRVLEEALHDAAGWDSLVLKQGLCWCPADNGLCVTPKCIRLRALLEKRRGNAYPAR